MEHHKTNSVIYRNPEKTSLIDFTLIGTIKTEDSEIRINQHDHFFQVGDALYFNPTDIKFGKAMAINSIESEVCGVVSEVIDNDEFIIVTEGFVKTDRYNFAIDSPLYLSEVIPGFMMSAEPTHVVKQVAIQTLNGIHVSIQMGYHISNNPVKVVLEPYTKDELDDIILNVMG